MCIWRGIILLATWWLRANQFPSNKLSTFVSFVFPLAPSGGSWDVALSRHCLLCLLCWSLDAPSSIMLRNGMFAIKALNNTSGFSPFARGVKAYCTCIPSFKSHASGRRHESGRLTFEAHKPVQTVLFPAINHRIRLHPFYPLIRFEKGFETHSTFCMASVMIVRFFLFFFLWMQIPGSLLPSFLAQSVNVCFLETLNNVFDQFLAWGCFNCGTQAINISLNKFILFYVLCVVFLCR